MIINWTYRFVSNAHVTTICSLVLLNAVFELQEVWWYVEPEEHDLRSSHFPKLR